MIRWSVSSATVQQQAGSISREGGNVNRAWDIDEVLFTSKGAVNNASDCTASQGAACVTDGVNGLLATDRPNVIKLYGAYTFPFGTQVGLNFYGGSGEKNIKKEKKRRKLNKRKIK